MNPKLIFISRWSIEVFNSVFIIFFSFTLFQYIAHIIAILYAIFRPFYCLVIIVCTNVFSDPIWISLTNRIYRGGVLVRLWGDRRLRIYCSTKFFVGNLDDLVIGQINLIRVDDCIFFLILLLVPSSANQPHRHYTNKNYYYPTRIAFLIFHTKYLNAYLNIYYHFPKSKAPHYRKAAVFYLRVDSIHEFLLYYILPLLINNLHVPRSNGS